MRPLTWLAVQYEDHLSLHEVNLHPSTERVFASVAGWCFVRLSAGAGYCFGCGPAKEIGVGEVLVVPPAGSIVIRVSQLGPVRLHYFHFQPERLVSLMTLSERQHITDMAESADKSACHLPAIHEIAAWFAVICELPQPANPFVERCRILALVAAWFDPFFKESSRSRAQDLPNFTAQSRFRELMQKMPEAELIMHSPAELSQLCRCSVTRFRRLFRALFGMTFHSKRAQLRLERGRQMLLESNLSIKDVGTACGYPANRTFNTLFKKHFGISPNQMRHRAD